MKTVLVFLLLVTSSAASGIEEVNLWRSRNGLPRFEEDKRLTRFAQYKAEWRASRLLQNGHQGPRCPADCREGTGEATSDWGWLTCVMEETGRYAGAGVAIGPDGQRYMVLVVRGTRGSAPIGRKVRPCRTAHLTPDAPRIRSILRR